MGKRDAVTSGMARYEGDFARDGFLIVRQLFAPDRIAALRSVLDSALEKHTALNPESGEGATAIASFFHLNNPFYFPPGSPQLSLLLEAAADPEIQQLFEHVAGAPPTFSVRASDPFSGGFFDRNCENTRNLPPISARIPLKPRELLASTFRGGFTRRSFHPVAAGIVISSADSEEQFLPNPVLLLERLHVQLVRHEVLQFTSCFRTYFWSISDRVIAPGGRYVFPDEAEERAALDQIGEGGGKYTNPPLLVMY